MMKQNKRLHLAKREKLKLLQQVVSPVLASDMAEELDGYTFAQLRDLRGVIHIIAQGRK